MNSAGMHISSDESSITTSAMSVAEQYRALLYRRWLLLGLLGLTVLGLVVADLTTGPAAFGWREVLGGLFNPDTLNKAQTVILWDIRLPYALMAVMVGGCLGLAGAEMQTVLNNPLASPFTLGVASAACLGAALAIAFGGAIAFVPLNVLVPVSAFVFAAASTMLIQLLARFYGAGVGTLVLFGIAVYFTMNSLIWLVQYVASADTVQQIVFWTMGSLARATWGKLAIVAAVLAICLPFALRSVWVLTTLRNGEDHARSLGIGVERLRMRVLLRASLLTGVAIAFVGEIGFIGLVAPHMARLVFGEDHRFYLPASALAGALLMSFASVISKVLVPGVVLPVGVVTALIGIPLFLTLILSRRGGIA